MKHTLPTLLLAPLVVASCQILAPAPTWTTVDTSAFKQDDYSFMLYDWNRHYDIVQTPEKLTITLKVWNRKKRAYDIYTHTSKGVDKEMAAMVQRIISSGYCPTPYDERLRVEIEGAGCGWKDYKWYVWFHEEYEHMGPAFNELNEYIFRITPEWHHIPAWLKYSKNPPKHVQAPGLCF